ncbi:MAG: hypothetical protein AB7F50_07375 [Fimbriimonadaceae bacterium]
MLSTTAVLCCMAVLGPSRKVSVEIEPMSLERALERISAETGTKLGAIASMKPTVVQVSVTDVEPDALLAKVAEVVGGTWRVEGDGTMRLYEDTEKTRQLAREALAARTKKFDDEIAKLRKELADSGDFDAAKIREQAGIVTEETNEGGERRLETRMGGPGMRFNMAAMPGGRAIVRAVEAMSGRDFATIGEGQRVVFSSAPTAMQKRLGGNPLRDAQTFLDEEQKMRDLMPRRGPGGRPGGETVGQQQRPTLGKVFLIANGERDSVRLEYFVASTTGEIVGRGFLSLGGAQDFSFDRTLTGQAETPKAPQDGLKVSEGAKSAAKALQSPGGLFGQLFGTTSITVIAGPGGEQNVISFEPQGEGNDRTAADTSLLDKLTKPSEFDPLSLFCGEAIRVALGDVDTVACLPDSLLSHAAGAIVRERSAKDFLDGDGSPIKVETQDGWTLVTPKDLLRSRAERADRFDLELLATNTRQNGVMRLADLARYSLGAPAVSGGVDSAVVTAIDPGANRRFADVYNDSRAALQVFGKLQGPDFAALEQGIVKPIVGLSGATQAVAGMVFNSADGPNVQRQQQTQDAPSPRGQTIELAVEVRGGGGPGQMFRNMMNRSMLDERTEVLPAGLPGGTSLTMQTERREVIYAFNQGGGNGRYTTAEQLGREAAMGEMFAQQGSNVIGVGNRGTESYVPTTEARYTMTFLLAPNITMTRTLVDPARADTSAGTSANLLPDKFRQAYQKGYEETKARVDGRIRQREGRRGGGNPPPPLG